MNNTHIKIYLNNVPKHAFSTEVNNDFFKNILTLISCSYVNRSLLACYVLVHTLVIPWSYLSHILVIPWSYLGHTLVLPWSYLGHTLVIPWPYLGHTVVIPWSYLGHTLIMAWSYFGHTLVITWSYLGHILAIPWSHLGHTLVIPWSYLGHTLVMPWSYLVQTLAPSCIPPELINFKFPEILNSTAVNPVSLEMEMKFISLGLQAICIHKNHPYFHHHTSHTSYSQVCEYLSKVKAPIKS